MLPKEPCQGDFNRAPSALLEGLNWSTLPGRGGITGVQWENGGKEFDILWSTEPLNAEIKLSLLPLHVFLSSDMKCYATV
jgi:hypothetical protein